MNSHAREVAAILEVMEQYDRAKADVRDILSASPSREEIFKMTASFDFRTSAAEYLIRAMKWTCRHDSAEAEAAVKALSQWGASTIAERVAMIENIVIDIEIPF